VDQVGLHPPPPTIPIKKKELPRIHPSHSLPTVLQVV
jgi:hypothetical protein